MLPNLSLPNLAQPTEGLLEWLGLGTSKDEPCQPKKKKLKTAAAVESGPLPPINSADSQGVAVYKVLDADGPDSVARWRQSLAASVNAAPEFQPVEGETPLFDRLDIKLAVGGFAALGHSSSFHNEFARALRFRAEQYVVEKDLFGLGKCGVDEGKRLEQIVDRTMVRRPGQKPTSESWHRDVARGTSEGDKVFGGWINLDTDNDQYFSCVPGSSDEQPEKGVDYEQGFAKIGASSVASVQARARRVVIPPGHMVVFNERTIHEVAAVPNSGATSSCRLFFGWRVTTDTTPLFYDVERRLREQDGMPLKSGQHKHAYSDDGRYSAMLQSGQANGRNFKYHPCNNTLGFRNYPGGPPMYPSAYWGQQDPEMVEEFCAALRPCLLKQRYFNPAIVDGVDSKGKPKTRNVRSGDSEDDYVGSCFKGRRGLAQEGVLCNFDLSWDDGRDGGRTAWSIDVTNPLKADTMRSLTETTAALIGHPDGRRVRWMQRPYDDAEIEIHTPQPLARLAALVAEHKEARAKPVLEHPSPLLYPSVCV